jgi:hypothetical protein
MAWTQLVAPRLNTTDTPGSCLRFTQTVYGARAQHYSAYIAYEATQFKHAERQMPNVAVTVWFTWFGTINGDTRQWGHVAVWVPERGKFLTSPLWWAAGKASQWVDSLEDFTRILGPSTSYLGWSEDLNGLRIVSATQTGFRESEMLIIHHFETNKYFAVGQQYLRHLSFSPHAVWMAGHLNQGGTVLDVNNTGVGALDVNAILNTFSIPTSVWSTLGPDQSWSAVDAKTVAVDSGALAASVASAVGNVNVNVDALASAIASKLGAPGSEPITKAAIQSAIEANYKESK